MSREEVAELARAGIAAAIEHALSAVPAELARAGIALTSCDAFDDLRLRVLRATTLAAGGDAAALRRDEDSAGEARRSWRT